MKSVYVIHVDLLKGDFDKLTDKEVIALYKKGKDTSLADYYESVEAFAEALNNNKCISLSEVYVRVVDSEKGFFPIAKVSRDDLDAAGFDVSEVSDSTMELLAKKLGDSYVGNGFWIDLQITADYLEIPRKEENEYED